MTISFKGAHFPKDVILYAVFFYLRYGVYPIPIEMVRQKYFNNIIEQEHRFIKRRIRPMLGFKSFDSAASTLAGIELVNMIRKGQFTPGLSLFQQFVQLVG